jgi:hypothetical protein
LTSSTKKEKKKRKREGERERRKERKKEKRKERKKVEANTVSMSFHLLVETCSASPWHSTPGSSRESLIKLIVILF